jgi:phage baseplate assembly protein W
MPLDISFNITDLNGTTPGDWYDMGSIGNNSPTEIMQCVHSLINTPIGSVMLDRRIGIDMSFVDMPFPIAQNMVAAEVIDKLRQYEPRATFRSIGWTIDSVGDLAGQGHIICNLVVSIP